jgi:hypothetical protein
MNPRRSIRRARGRALFAVALLLLAAPSLARAAEPAASLSPEDLLRSMSMALADAGAYRFHAEVTFDQTLLSGQKLQFAGAADVTVKLPNEVAIDYRDDLSAKKFWYDGEKATLLDVPRAAYSEVALSGNVDDALRELQESYDLSLPLADLISNDVYAVIDAHALAWKNLGIHDVEGTPAHHIAIVGDGTDLQLWIQADGKPLPLKLVITYKAVPMAPQYTAVLMDWKLGGRVSDDTFESELPDGAKKIEFLVAEDGR